MSYVEDAKRLRPIIEEATKSLSDETAINAPELFPKWKSKAYPYKKENRVDYMGKLYKCLQDHTSQEDWTPDAAVSLWVEIADPSIEWPEWKQPTGAHDAYAKGAKVTHLFRHWTSDVDNNTWEPGAYGWTEA